MRPRKGGEQKGKKTWATNVEVWHFYSIVTKPFQEINAGVKISLCSQSKFVSVCLSFVSCWQCFSLNSPGRGRKRREHKRMNSAKKKKRLEVQERVTRKRLSEEEDLPASLSVSLVPLTWLHVFKSLFFSSFSAITQGIYCYPWWTPWSDEREMTKHPLHEFDLQYLKV